MEQALRDHQSQVVKKKVHSIHRRPGRKPLEQLDSLPKKPKFLKISTGEQQPSLSPKSIQLQAFRNYSTKGLQKGASEAILGKLNSLKNNLSHMNKSGNYVTLMNKTNISSNHGPKSISTEPTNNPSSKGTRHLLMN